MLFNSISFIIFFPIVVSLFFIIGHKYRWLLLLASSYFFYAYWNVGYLLLIITTTLTSYFIALAIERSETTRNKKTLTTACLLVNLSILFVFKYFNFFASSLSGIFGYAEKSVYLELLLPVGISFYTFQSLSYVIDVYRGSCKAEKHLGIFALFVSFFPQLVAGPIERSSHLLPQFKEKKKLSLVNVKKGVQLIVWGFFLKLVIADRLAVYVNEVYNNLGDYSGGHYAMATYLFAFQIFCDFCGYSTIAVGTSRIFGYDLMENFRRPYFATSIRDFWSRWHISLSTWFRDYLFIPLGGNRVKIWRSYLNLLIVFLVSGLWHGANWTFVAWGAIHGTYLVSGKLSSNYRNTFKNKIGLSRGSALNSTIQIFITFNLVCFAWIFFRANNINDAIYLVSNLFSGWQFSLLYLGKLILPFTFDNSSIGIFFIAILGILIMETVHYTQEVDRNWILKKWQESDILNNISIVMLVLAILFLGEYNSNSSFIYFQF